VLFDALRCAYVEVSTSNGNEFVSTSTQSVARKSRDVAGSGRDRRSATAAGDEPAASCPFIPVSYSFYEEA